MPKESDGRTGVSPVHKDAASDSHLVGERPAVPPATPELRCRRRHLPHWEQAGATYFITFRLREGQFTEDERQIVLSSCLYWNRRKWRVHSIVVMPDHVHVLARPLPIPSRTGETPVLPNEGSTGETPVPPRQYYSLAEILHSVKSYAAHAVNQKRGATGRLWAEESFDRIVRNESEFEEKLHYMLNNPVKARLVEDGFEYQYLWCEGLEER